MSAVKDTVDAERYRKLRVWMSTNQQHLWREVCELAAVGCYVDFDNFDEYLDQMPERPE